MAEPLAQRGSSNNKSNHDKTVEGLEMMPTTEENTKGEQLTQFYHDAIEPRRQQLLQRLTSGGWCLHMYGTIRALERAHATTATRNQEAFGAIIYLVAVFVGCPVMGLLVFVLQKNEDSTSILAFIGLAFLLMSLAQLGRAIFAIHWSTVAAMGLMFLVLVSVVGVLGGAAIGIAMVIAAYLYKLVKALQKSQTYVRFLELINDTAIKIRKSGSERRIDMDSCESGIVMEPLNGIYLSDEGLVHPELWEPHSAALHLRFYSTHLGWELQGGRFKGVGQKAMIILEGFVSRSPSRAAYWVEANPNGFATALCHGQWNARGEFQGTRTDIIIDTTTIQQSSCPYRFLPASSTNCRVHHTVQCDGCLNVEKPLIGIRYTAATKEGNRSYDLCEICMAKYKEGTLVDAKTPPVPAHEMTAIESLRHY